MSKSLSLKTILILQGAVILYSFADVTAKLASRHPFLSLPYLLWMGAELGILGVYALCWQQILKRVEMSVAYSNRAAAVVWTPLWGVLLFGDQLTPKNLLGIGILFAGIWMVSRDG